MRLTKTFEIKGNDKIFKVKELRIKEIISLIADENLDNLELSTMKSKFEDVFLPMCSNITMDEISEMAPSEVKQIWEEFREVNASFFELAQKMGLKTVLDRLIAAVLEDFGKIAVDLSSQAMLES